MGLLSFYSYLDLGLLERLPGLLIGNKDVPRRPVLFITGIVMVGSFALTLLFANINPMVSYIFAAICGFACYVQYPIFLNLPHELKGMNPQKLTIMFGMFWAIAYAGQTIATIIWSYLLGTAGYVPSMIFFVAAISVYIFLVPTLPETRPKENLVRKIA